MPINGKPLLLYWLRIAKKIKVEKLLINLHYQSEIVSGFLDKLNIADWATTVYEHELLGTAGTLRESGGLLKDSTVFLAHADNFCRCDFASFVRYHQTARPINTVITMMTFETATPMTCGVVETTDLGIVTAFYEKIPNPPGNRANGAVYLLEPEVTKWIIDNPHITDFSTQVLPNFIGRIATWHNTGLHVDIGNIQDLRMAQDLAKSDKTMQFDETLSVDDAWMKEFLEHPIHQLIAKSTLK